MIGSYEQSLRERAIAARQRLFGGSEPPRVPRARTVYTKGNAPLPPPPEPVDPKAYRPIVKSITSMVEVSPFRWREIVDEVLRKHEISMTELCSDRRSRYLCLARQEVCYRLSRETGMSLPVIGRKIGDRDHTTVLHSIRKYAARLEEEAAARDKAA